MHRVDARHVPHNFLLHDPGYLLDDLARRHRGHLDVALGDMEDWLFDVLRNSPALQFRHLPDQVDDLNVWHLDHYFVVQHLWDLHFPLRRLPHGPLDFLDVLLVLDSELLADELHGVRLLQLASLLLHDHVRNLLNDLVGVYFRHLHLFHLLHLVVLVSHDDGLMGFLVLRLPRRPHHSRRSGDGRYRRHSRDSARSRHGHCGYRADRRDRADLRGHGARPAAAPRLWGPTKKTQRQT
mmetsp:Transcript_76993/g.214027  ORF Transcript_76993/g.214027 Transcript_76993/m.214027 type:complete len:238 (+) Transcript_76993:1557-2270(+)